MALFQMKNAYPLLKHPEKYIAENKVVTARSGWEISFIFDFLDKHSSVLSWTSEDIIIPYCCPVRNNSVHRYFPDFMMEVKEATGTIKDYLVEIKPFIETNPPTKPKRMNKSYIDRVNTYIKNCAKWDAARTYCNNLRKQGKNIEFVIMTEKGIYYEDGRFERICFFKT